MKRLVFHEVMSDEAEVITSSEFALVTDRKRIDILFKKPTQFNLNDDWDEISPGRDTSPNANTKQVPRVSANISSNMV